MTSLNRHLHVLGVENLDDWVLEDVAEESEETDHIGTEVMQGRSREDQPAGEPVCARGQPQAGSAAPVTSDTSAFGSFPLGRKGRHCHPVQRQPEVTHVLKHELVAHMTGQRDLGQPSRTEHALGMREGQREAGLPRGIIWQAATD